MYLLPITDSASPAGQPIDGGFIAVLYAPPIPLSYDGRKEKKRELTSGPVRARPVLYLLCLDNHERGHHQFPALRGDVKTVAIWRGTDTLKHLPSTTRAF